MTLFDFVKTQLPILDVISEHVKLKPMGNYYKGPCPFHSEKDASFTVSPDRQIFYCFGCQATGDVIAFFAKMENLSQIEAVKLLVEQYSLELPAEIKTNATKEFGDFARKDHHAHLCEHVAMWAHQQLKKSPQAQKYLAARGIQEETIQKFLVGYFPGGATAIETLLKDLRPQGVLLKDLMELGIVAEGRNHLFSPWEERILFPIKDGLSNFCGFGGRIFHTQDDRAKYINSKESEWFIKGKLLFGFDTAKKVIQKKEAVFLVEGYMDCIVMAQYGYENTVATLGTACTIDHLKLLARQAPSIHLLYDGDKAGQNALLRIAQLCWQVNADLKVIQLPANHDPASFLTQGLDLNTMINEGKDLFHFFITEVSNDFLNQPLGKKMILAEKVTDVILSIQDPFKQELLLHQAAQTMQIPFDMLKNFLTAQRKQKEIKKQQASSYKTTTQTATPHITQEIRTKNNLKTDKTETSLLEEKIFSVILNSLGGENVLKLDDWAVIYLSPRIQTALVTLNTYAQHNDIPLNQRYTLFLNSLNEEDRTWVIKMNLTFDQSGSQELLNDLVSQFFKNNWKHMVRDIKEQMKKAEEIADLNTVKNLFEKVTELKQHMLQRGLI